ncbi:MAG: hypothetical protein IT385_01925 [Deltaproteobacteria bacterium]|nr:hypothetical protein [Deltaproteobacteria bacterium]
MTMHVVAWVPIVSLLVSGVARAVEPTIVSHAAHCKDGQREPPARICQDYEAAPMASLADPKAAKALAVWSRVAEPVEALTDRRTGLVLLSPEARMRDGRRFPPAAYICPGAPPVVYVPWSMVEQVYDGDYPEDFLAFVLGHELGHRLNDFTDDGCKLAAFERPGRDENEEQLADFRGAFFAAVAGFDTRKLARDEVVTRFLQDEFKLRAGEIATRATALTAALRYFDAYETLYQAGLALTLSGDAGSAVRLLDWADELVKAQGVPVPEITVAHALALIADATPDAPWLDRLAGHDAPGAALACRPVFPAHTALSQEPRAGPVRSDRARRAVAKRSLERALRLLQRAQELGASALATGTATACAHFLLGDPDEALRLHTRAMQRGLTRRTAAPAIAQALMANEALFRFAKWIGENPTPPGELGAKVQAWLPTFSLHPALGAWLRGGAGVPASPALAACQAKAPPPPPLPAAPFVKDPTGACPAGWTRAHVMPSPEAHALTGSGTGVTVCERSGARLSHVVLPPLSDPPRARVDLTLVDLEPVPTALASFDTWACHCDALAPRGVSDAGEDAWLGSCPALGAGSALIRADARGRVRAVTVLPLP